MSKLGSIDLTDLNALLVRYGRAIDGVRAAHARVTELFEPSGAFCEAAMLLALKRMGDDHAWGESVLRLAVTLREAGVDVLGVLDAAVKSGARVREPPAGIAAQLGDSWTEVARF